MFSFARQLVRTAEGIIAQPQNGQHHQGQGQGRPREPDNGFRVLYVEQDSAGFRAGIQSLFDFVVGINGHDIVGKSEEQVISTPNEHQQDIQNPYSPQPAVQQNPYAPNPRVHNHRPSMSFSTASAMMPQLVPPQSEKSPLEPFLAEINECRGRSVSLDIWSSKGRIRRTVVVPVPEVGGLGLSLQWTPLHVADHVWHILNVSKNSPAEQAGLISHSDYIVGAENGLLATGGEDLLGRVVQKLVQTHQHERHIQQETAAEVANQDPTDSTSHIVDSQPELELYVYNAEHDTLRAVRIRPRLNWGGSGLLGCGVGYGLLHRLPALPGQEDLVAQQHPSQQLHHQPPGQNQTHPLYGAPSPYGYEAPLQNTIYEEQEHMAPPQVDGPGTFTPASFIPAAGPPPGGNTSLGSGPPPMRKKRHHYPSVGSTLSPSAGSENGGSAKLNDELAAYFAEEEKRSKELDGGFVPSLPEGETLPPPPPPGGAAN